MKPKPIGIDKSLLHIGDFVTFINDAGANTLGWISRLTGHPGRAHGNLPYSLGVSLHSLKEAIEGIAPPYWIAHENITKHSPEPRAGIGAPKSSTEGVTSMPLFLVIGTRKLTKYSEDRLEAQQVERVVVNKSGIVAQDANAALVIASRGIEASVSDEDLSTTTFVVKPL